MCVLNSVVAAIFDQPSNTFFRFAIVTATSGARPQLTEISTQRVQLNKRLDKDIFNEYIVCWGLFYQKRSFSYMVQQMLRAYANK